MELHDEQHGEQPDRIASEGDRPLTAIARDVMQHLQNILRAEMRLAAAELKEKIQSSRKAGLWLGAAALLGFLAACCITTACIAALAIVLPLWLAALIMGVMLGAGAGGAFLLGRLALEEVDPVPQQTLETLKDNADWVRDRVT